MSDNKIEPKVFYERLTNIRLALVALENAVRQDDWDTVAKGSKKVQAEATRMLFNACDNGGTLDEAPKRNGFLGGQGEPQVAIPQTMDVNEILEGFRKMGAKVTYTQHGAVPEQDEFVTFDPRRIRGTVQFDQSLGITQFDEEVAKVFRTLPPDTRQKIIDRFKATYQPVKMKLRRDSARNKA